VILGLGMGVQSMNQATRRERSPGSAGADCLIGRMEKNLWRHGSQRKDGKPRMRPRNPVGPGTYSGEIRLRSKFPQMAQCAYFHWLNGTERARKRMPHSVQRQGMRPAAP